MGLTPVIDGKVRTFSAGGLYNGLVLLIDDQTLTFWDHVTGKAVYGKRVDQTMATFPTQVMSVKAALGKWPDLRISLSKPSVSARLMNWFLGNRYRSSGWLPPGFRDTMGKPDPRLGEQVSGMGIIEGGVARFYPFNRLPARTQDTIGKRTLTIEHNKEAGPPEARWDDDKTMPLQVLMRWYGFSATYPGCEIWRPSHHGKDSLTGETLKKSPENRASSAITAAPGSPVQGRITIVDYRASWCAPCRKLGEKLKKWQHGRADVVIVEVDASEWDDDAFARVLPDSAGLPVLDIYDKHGTRIKRLSGPEALKFEPHVPRP